MIAILLTSCATTSTMMEPDDCGLYYSSIFFSDYPPEVILKDGEDIMDAIPERCRD